MKRIINPYLENFHAYNGKLHDRYTTCIYNIAYDTFADNDITNPLAGYVEPDKLLQRAREVVFNFDYNISNKTVENEFLGKFNLKDSFEKAFIDKYLTDEIAYESFTLWQSKLKGKLQEIVPLLNLKFNTFCQIELFDLRGGYKYTEHIDNTHKDDDDINRIGSDSRTNDGTNNTGQVDSSFPVNEVDAYAHLEGVNYASGGASIKNTTHGTSKGSNTVDETRGNTGEYHTDRVATREDRNLIDNLKKIKGLYNDMITGSLKEFSYLFMGIM